MDATEAPGVPPGTILVVDPDGKHWLRTRDFVFKGSADTLLYLLAAPSGEVAVEKVYTIRASTDKRIVAAVDREIESLNAIRGQRPRSLIEVKGHVRMHNPDGSQTVKIRMELAPGGQLDTWLAKAIEANGIEAGEFGTIGACVRRRRR